MSGLDEQKDDTTTTRVKWVDPSDERAVKEFETLREQSERRFREAKGPMLDVTHLASPR